MTTDFLFVYGSLRKQAHNPQRQRLMRDCEYVSDGYLLGRLYQLGDYPGAIAANNADERVYGELYRMPNPETVLARLDAYEECAEHNPAPHEYQRRQLPIWLANDATLVAWVYLFNGDPTQLAQIKSGDYLAPERPA